MCRYVHDDDDDDYDNDNDGVSMVPRSSLFSAPGYRFIVYNDDNIDRVIARQEYNMYICSTHIIYGSTSEPDTSI